MANEQQLAILSEGGEKWNKWRTENRDVVVDLSQADLHEADLRRANLYGADLNGANLSNTKLRAAYLSAASLHEANLRRANLCEVNLDQADLSGADLSGANLSGAKLNNANLNKAKLRGADLSGADLRGTILRMADLREADLHGATCIDTYLEGASLIGCRVFGMSVWNLHLDNTTIQTNLIISNFGEPMITVDNLEVAQFMYLMLHNEKIRQVIDTITGKVVLILGRFTPERKQVLDAVRNELRKRDYVPIVFDFEKPSSRDLTETVSTLAHMARFVIADLTEARSIPQELSIIVPTLPSVAVQPLIQEDDSEYSMVEHWQRFPWVLDIYRYHDLNSLLANLNEYVIDPAEQRANELMPPQQKTTPPA